MTTPTAERPLIQITILQKSTIDANTVVKVAGMLFSAVYRQYLTVYEAG
jgi:hypothetical protein